MTQRLSELAEAYVLTHRRTEPSRKVGRKVLGRFIAEVGDIDPADLTRAHLVTWWTAVEANAAPASKRAYYATVKAFLDWLRDDGVCTVNLAAVVAKPKTGRKPPVTMTDHEVELVRAACTN